MDITLEELRAFETTLPTHNHKGQRIWRWTGEVMRELKKHKKREAMANFKKGDWVKSSSGNILKVVDKKKSICDSTITLYDISENNVTTYSHWTPQSGEWCWMNNSRIHREFPSLTLIKYNKYFISDYNNGVLEPFIGELPDFVKESNE